MGYIDNHLTEGEEVVFRTKRHWINTLPWPTLFWLIAIGSFILAMQFESGGGTNRFFKMVAYVVAGIGLVVFLIRHLINWASEFGVTSKRVIIKTGLVRRHTLEVILQKVESIGVQQSVLGRILGYGTLTVTGSGGSSEPYRDIAEPFEFRQHVQVQIGELDMDDD